MNQSPKRKRNNQVTASTPPRPNKYYHPQTTKIENDDDDDFHLNTNTTSHFHENLSSGILKSPFLSRVNNSGSTSLSGKTSYETESRANSFYSQDDHNLHSLAIKYHDTPYARTPENHETEIVLDQSFVSEMSAPPSPLNFDDGEKLSPVRPENEPPFHVNLSSKKSKTCSVLPSMDSCAISSPKLVPNRSKSPILEDTKKEKSLMGRIFDDSYDAEYVNDEYSSSSSAELILSHSEDPVGPLGSSHSIISSSVFQNNSDDPEYDLLPNSNSTSRTLFREDSSCGFDDGNRHTSHQTSQNSTPATPDRLLTNQHQHRLEDLETSFTPFTKQRNLSLPPSSSFNHNDPQELGTDSSSLFRSRSHNRVLKTATPLRPLKKLDTPSRQYPRPQLSTTPDRLTSRASTPPRSDQLQLPYQLLHSPPLSSSTSSPSNVMRGVGFTSPPARERTTIIEESWPGCKSLFDDIDHQASLNPPQGGSTPLRLKENHESPEKRLRRNGSKEKVLHSSESNVGKRSRSPFSSAPSPTEMRLTQHQKLDTPESSPCPTPRRQFNTSLSLSHGSVSRPLPDQSVFESSQHANPHQNSPVCPPTPERVSHHRHGHGNEGDHPCDDQNVFFLRTNEDDDDEALFRSPRLHRQNSLEENKILMSSQQIPHSSHASHQHPHSIPDDIFDSQHSSELHEMSVSSSMSINTPATATVTVNSSLNTNLSSSSDDEQQQGHDQGQGHEQENDNIIFYRDFINEGLMGSGTFAEVYRVCLKSDTTQKFAVKKCRKKFKNKSERENLLNEVRIMQAIAEESSTESFCPYVLHFYNAWQEDSYFFVQLELAERGTLRDLMNIYSHRRQQIPTSDILQIFYQITSGLKHIHKFHIVHLDIKPQNILITTDGILKIGDFGIAIYEGANVADERHEGDTRYLPGELLNSFDRYYTADIFSLGLSIYDICLVPELDTLPYSGQVWQDIRAGIIHDLTLKKYGSRLKSFYHLILQCISADPSNRPTAEEILSHPLFQSKLISMSTSILKESPIRAPSPIYNPSLSSSSLNVATDVQVSTPVVATPTSHHRSEYSNWQQRIQSPSPYPVTPSLHSHATPYRDQMAPFSFRNYHSNQSLSELASSNSEPHTPTTTTVALSQFYRSNTPRHLPTPSRDPYSANPNVSSDISSSSSSISTSSQPSTPQQSASSPTHRIPHLSGIRLAIPTAPPTPSQESLTTPTSRTSRPPQLPFPPTPTPIAPPATVRAPRKAGSKPPKKK
jgi:serine/threonine protein kinase